VVRSDHVHDGCVESFVVYARLNSDTNMRYIRKGAVAKSAMIAEYDTASPAVDKVATTLFYILAT
jgi:hypothetical protein